MITINEALVLIAAAAEGTGDFFNHNPGFQTAAAL